METVWGLSQNKWITWKLSSEPVEPIHESNWTGSFCGFESNMKKWGMVPYLGCLSKNKTVETWPKINEWHGKEPVLSKWIDWTDSQVNRETTFLQGQRAKQQKTDTTQDHINADRTKYTESKRWREAEKQEQNNRTGHYFGNETKATLLTVLTVFYYLYWIMRDYYSSSRDIKVCKWL